MFWPIFVFYLCAIVVVPYTLCDSQAFHTTFVIQTSTGPSQPVLLLCSIALSLSLSLSVVNNVLQLLKRELISSANLAESLVNSYIVRIVICLVDLHMMSMERGPAEPGGPQRVWSNSEPVQRAVRRDTTTATLCHGRR